MRFFIGAFVVAFFSFASFAGEWTVPAFALVDADSSPALRNSPAARGAMRDYQKAVQTAEDTFRQAKLAAEKTLVGKLKPAL